MSFPKLSIWVYMISALTSLALVSCDSLVSPSFDSSSITDEDGNKYTTVKIGDQVWSVENLRTTKYSDGSSIPLVISNSSWAALSTPGYCYYDNTTNIDSIVKYGALYNWYAVQTKKLAPRGWHVATDSDWTILVNFLISNGYNWDGTVDSNKIAKSLASHIGWQESHVMGTPGFDLIQNNKSGFTGFPSGYREPQGFFCLSASSGQWWSIANTDAGYRDLNYSNAFLFRMNGTNSCGFSVRLVMD